METLDLILLLCFIPAIVRGLSKGLVEQLVSLVSVIGGVWLAFKFSQPVGEWLGGWLTMDAKVVSLVAFAVVVLCAILLLALLGKVITKLIDLASLGWMNRLLGLAFALLKTALLIGLAIFLFDAANARWMLVKPEVLERSLLYGPLRDAALKVFPFLQNLILNA